MFDPGSRRVITVGVGKQGAVTGLILLGGALMVAAFMWDFRNAANGGNPNPFNWVLFMSGEAIGLLSFLRSLRHTPRVTD
jgi:hypothetical protein